MNTVTGTILLVSGKSDQAKIIQAFQKRADEESGRWNHSGILLQTRNDIYVIEEAPIKDRKLKAASKPTLLSHYLNGNYELLYLKPANLLDEKLFERVLMDHVAIPYDYFSLVHDQVIRTLQKVWVGKTRKASRRMVCHEFSQYVWHVYSQGVLFKDYFKGDVSAMYKSAYFTRSNTL